MTPSGPPAANSLAQAAQALQQIAQQAAAARGLGAAFAPAYMPGGPAPAAMTARQQAQQLAQQQAARPYTLGPAFLPPPPQPSPQTQTQTQAGRPGPSLAGALTAEQRRIDLLGGGFSRRIGRPDSQDDAAARARTLSSDRSVMDLGRDRAAGSLAQVAENMRRHSDDWARKPTEMMAKAGREFYGQVYAAGASIAGVLGKPAAVARDFGVDKADPNLYGTLNAAYNLSMARIGKGLSPIVEGAAGLMDRASQKGGLMDTIGGGIGAGVNALGGAWRWGLNFLPWGGNDPNKPRGLGDAMIGGVDANGNEPGKKPLRSMAGMPSASLGSMEQWYDQALMSSLNMGSGTLEADLLKEQVNNMAERLGGLLEKIEANTANAVPSFR